MKVMHLAVVATLAVSVGSTTHATVLWGRHGHEISGRAAVTSLPETMPPFFRAAADQLAWLNAEPDRWRDRDVAAMDEAWKYDHYVDFEVIPPAALQAPDRFSYLHELHRTTDLEQPARDAGLLPYRMLELYQRLVQGFRLWQDAAGDSARRVWIEERIINDAGILGHYVTDGANPQHTSVHHNGWNESYPNPRGYTTDRTFHSRFESRFVEARISVNDVVPRITAQPRRLSDARADILSYLRASNAQLDRLYQLEQQQPFGPENTAAAHREFAVQRLVAGAEMLRALWWTAWLASGEASD